jgi:hypothetical protein
MRYKQIYSRRDKLLEAHVDGADGAYTITHPKKTAVTAYFEEPCACPFWFPTDAIVAAKSLLLIRDPSLLKKIEFIIARVMEEERENTAISIWALSLECFGRDESPRLVDLVEQVKRLPLDFDESFVLFCVQQRRIQAIKSASLGGEVVDAIGGCFCLLRVFLMWV